MFYFQKFVRNMLLKLVFNWNHLEMRFLNLRINFYLLRTFFLMSVVFVLFLLSLRFGQISPLAFFRWFTATSDRNAESCNRIPSNYCLHSCCLSHHVFDQVNLWPAWVGFETAISWQCSPGTAETQRLYPLRHRPSR